MPYGIAMGAHGGARTVTRKATKAHRGAVPRNAMGTAMNAHETGE